MSPFPVSLPLCCSQVVYVAVKPDSGLLEFQQRLSDRLKSAGVNVVDSRAFVPHCTLLKLSGRLANDFHTIDPSLYAAFRALSFGEQPVRATSRAHLPSI